MSAVKDPGRRKEDRFSVHSGPSLFVEGKGRCIRVRTLGRIGIDPLSTVAPIASTEGTIELRHHPGRERLCLEVCNSIQQCLCVYQEEDVLRAARLLGRQNFSRGIRRAARRYIGMARRSDPSSEGSRAI